MTSRSNKAFSLLEVIITVAILSVAIMFIFRSFASAIASTKFSQNISLACFLAESHLWEIEQRHKDNLALPSPQGTEKIEERGFNWDYTILDTDIPELKKLKFTVSWKERLREKEYSVDFFTYLAPKE